MSEHRYTDSVGVPFSVDRVRTMWPRCRCGAVVLDIDAHIRAEESADLGDYPPMPRNYETCPNCLQRLILKHHCQPVLRPADLWVDQIHDHVGGTW